LLKRLPQVLVAFVSPFFEIFRFSFFGGHFLKLRDKALRNFSIRSSGAAGE
jgi:hypothetical protein